jgi:4-amino-4-deoxy-L-arabinose transferase-like glycosyltransferase
VTGLPGPGGQAAGEGLEPPPWRDLLLLAALAALLFLPGLGNRDLWNPDEPRYAEVVREMRAGGDYLVPHLNGRLYTQKPPLQFWAIAAAAALTGRLDETAVRLPAALAAIGTVLLTFDLARRLLGRRAAWIAAAALATCAKVLWQARSGQIDMLLLFLVTLALWFWARGYFEGRRRLYPLFFVAAGLATLAKGPVGLLPPLLAIVAFLLTTGDGQELRRLRVGRGLLLWAAIVLAWLVPAALHAGETLVQELVFRQTVTRYVDPWHHERPWHYYPTVLPGDFFPWSFLLPASLVAGWRGLAGRRRRAFHFALAWVVVTLVFFSLSPAKRTVYILTLYPGLALLVGGGLDVLERRWPRERRWLVGPVAGLAALVAALAIAAPWAVPRREELAALGADLGAALSLALLPLAVGAGMAWWRTRRGRVAASAGALAAGMAITVLAGFLTIAPRFDAVKSARPLSRILVERMAPGERYGIYPLLEPSFLFYTGRFAVELETEEELRRFLAGDGRIWVLAERDALARIAAPLPAVEVARDADIRRGYVLLRSTRPPALAAVAARARPGR